LDQKITELEGAKIYTPIRIAGLILGFACLVMPHVLPPPSGLSNAGWNVVGVALLMAIWWVTGPIHITATALIPLVAFPVLVRHFLKANQCKQSVINQLKEL